MVQPNTVYDGVRVAKFDEFEVCNGSDIGCSLYLQGCPHHCKDCFNPETWEMDGGQPFSDALFNQIDQTLQHSYIRRFTLLGGEPCIIRNKAMLQSLCQFIKQCYHGISIWLYSGYTYEELIQRGWKEVLQYIDVLVDGRFEIENKNFAIPFRGSTNQRIIDVQQSLNTNQVVLKKEFYHDTK